MYCIVFFPAKIYRVFPKKPGELERFPKNPVNLFPGELEPRTQLGWEDNLGPAGPTIFEETHIIKGTMAYLKLIKFGKLWKFLKKFPPPAGENQLVFTSYSIKKYFPDFEKIPGN